MSLTLEQLQKLYNAVDNELGISISNPELSCRAIAEMRKQYISTLSADQIKALAAA